MQQRHVALNSARRVFYYSWSPAYNISTLTGQTVVSGRNPKDMAFLKYGNIHEVYLMFESTKTERSTGEELALSPYTGQQA